jgi:hypothetical protein
MPIDDALRAATGRLLQSIDAPGAFSVMPLSGGRNNRVFRLDFADGRPAMVMKHYFHDSNDHRDRLRTEFAFSQAAWQSGLRCLPEPLAADMENRIGLYAFCQGERVAPSGVTAQMIEQALEFCITLNSPVARSAAGDLPMASDACRSLEDHIVCTTRRLERLKRSDMGNCAVTDFIANELAPCIDATVADLTDARAAGLWNDEGNLAQSELCLSASDFGFHNALVDADGTVTFLDFEYAGWDDPSKLVCDFFSQEAVPVPLQHFTAFAERIVRQLGLTDSHRARMTALLPLHRLKWICMMLEDFLPDTRKRRAFAAGGAASSLYLDERLVAARTALQKAHLLRDGLSVVLH